MKTLITSLTLAIVLGSTPVLSAELPLHEATPEMSTQALASAARVSSLPQISLPRSGEVLRLLVGKSLLLRSPEPLDRVSISNPDIASSVVVEPDQVLIHGLSTGSVTLMLWDAQGRTRSFDLRVEFDLRSLRENIQTIFPEQEIQVVQSGSSLILTGVIPSDEVGDRIVSLTQTLTPNVVSLLQIGEERRDAVLLQVRVAEVDRAALQDAGINIFSTGAGNTFGTATTQQFDSPAANVGSVPEGVQRGRDPQTSSLAAGGIGNKLEDSPGVIGLNNLLNIFLFRPDVNLGFTLRALEQRNLLQILAEPNVLALNGREASFLAGGEFPFPVVQGVTGVAGSTAISIVFKEFGIRLNFLPDIQDDGTILLKVAPEVSALDFSNALTISGFLIPALSTRRAETEVALRDGQTFAIAGLIDNRLTEVASRVPVLGDIPVLGKLFRSHAFTQNKTELVVMVTPRLVQALDPGEMPPTPTFPRPFLDENEFDEEGFDGEMGETPPQSND